MKKLIEDATLHSRTNLSTDDIISLLEFVLSINYFAYNDCFYKQIHGCAMGSPVRPVVANLCMEVIEDSALSTSTMPPKIWKRNIMIFDTRPKDFIVVSDDLTTANMDPCIYSKFFHTFCLVYILTIAPFLYTCQRLQTGSQKLVF